MGDAVMSAAHTAGSWRSHAVILAGEIHGFTVSRPGDTPRMIANVLPIDEGATEGEANARLIAAAPDLLTALEAIIAHWDAGNFSREPALWNPARAAIAKARGQS